MKTQELNTLGYMAVQLGAPVASVRDVITRRRIGPAEIRNGQEFYDAQAFSAVREALGKAGPVETRQRR